MDFAGWLTFEVWVNILEKIGIEDATLAMLLAIQGFTRDFLDGPQRRTTVETIRDTAASACTARMFAAACRAMQAIDFIPRLPEIRVATLVMTGELDQMTPVDYGPNGGGSRKICELIPDSQLVLLPGVGHTHIFQAPRETVDEIFRFLERVGHRSRTSGDRAPPSEADTTHDACSAGRGVLARKDSATPSATTAESASHAGLKE
jgi:pimeloyl-ACP methyl ester carboxylesterase